MAGVNSDLCWRICGRSGWNTNRKLLFKFPPPPPGCFWDLNYDRMCLLSLNLFFPKKYCLIVLFFLSGFILLLLRSQDYGGTADCAEFNLDASWLRFFRPCLFWTFEDIKDIKQNRKQRIKEGVRWKDKESHQTVEGSADKTAVACLNAVCHPWFKNAKWPKETEGWILTITLPVPVMAAEFHYNAVTIA